MKMPDGPDPTQRIRGLREALLAQGCSHANGKVYKLSYRGTAYSSKEISPKAINALTQYLCPRILPLDMFTNLCIYNIRSSLQESYINEQDTQSFKGR